MKAIELAELIENLPADKKKVLEDLVSVLVADAGLSVNNDINNSIKPGFGGGKGIIGYMADDFDAPLDDFKEYM